MMKNLALIGLGALLLGGCGGDTSGDTPSSGNIGSNTTPKQYNLWEYMVPNTNHTSTFTHSLNNVVSSYKTNYSVNGRKVEEVSDYASDEKTIYEKSNNKIIVRFEKAGKANGTYDLALSADINDIVTLRNSTCQLTKHFDTFEISDKSFQDVLEIKCANIPGYYQKNVGEIAQIEDNTGKNIRVLSN